MTPKRSLIDRLMIGIMPQIIADYAPPPERVDTNLWTLGRRARMPGGPLLPTRTSIVKLEGGDLLVISPPPVECGGLDALDALGPVRHVLAPNAFHYLNVRQFLARYPEATFWAAPGLFARIPGLCEGTELFDETTTPWTSAVDHASLRPTPEVSEVALFHRESATLILTDLAFNMVRFDGLVDRISWRMSGVPAGFGHSRTARMLLLKNRSIVTPFLEQILAWPFARILVAHGEAVESDAIGVFRRAFADYLR